MPNTRGSWTVDAAVNARWDAYNLDQTFRDEWDWSSADAAKYEPLQDTEARPNAPGPYCVYEKGASVIVANMSGKESDTENQVQRVPIQFTIHAKSTSSESGKSIAKRLALQVAEAFDDREKLSISDDSHIETIRGPDYCIREGDEQWAWVLQYDIVIDCEYSQAT